MLDRVMRFTNFHLIVIGIVALVVAGSAGFMYKLGFQNEGLLVRVGGGEGFQNDDSDTPVCGSCRKRRPCGCNNGKSSKWSKSMQPAPVAPCPRVMEPDLSKYVLKSSLPASNKQVEPDMSGYMLKTECPPVPDLSKYVLKSSIPKPQPVIIDNSGCKKEAGECPPCPRPRCPVVKCPEPTKCPTPAPCPRAVCPPTVVKCKSEEATETTVRPFLAPLNMGGFGSA